MKSQSLFDDPVFLKRLESLIDSESIDLEFKTAKGGFPGSFWETYSAFANTQGGTIVLGVREKGDDYIVDGLTIEEIKKYKRDFWNNVNNKQVVSANLLKDGDVRECEYKGIFILVFNIPRADRSQMPVYLKNNPENTYKRNNEGDYKCTSEDIRRMFADADIKHPKDSRILEGFTIAEDIDKESLTQYRQLVAALRPSHPWLLLDDIALLVKLGGYRKDRKTKEEGLTLAGLLMFGKYDSIVDPGCCPSYFPDYREYFSTDMQDRWTSRIYPDGTWEANLFQFYMKVYPRLAAVLPKPFILEKGIRVEETLTHIALREAFINTLVHCDYTIDSNITISLYRDRYIFSNPGSLLISLHQYYQGGESVCRNKALQQMFVLLGTAEKAGSGVDKILQGWEEANYRKPHIEETVKPDKVVLELPLISLLSNEVIKPLKSLFGAKIEYIGHDKLLTLAVCYKEGEVTNYRLQFVINKHSFEITQILKELCSGGYLVSSGNGRGTHYKLNNGFLNDKLAKVDSKIYHNKSIKQKVDSSNVDSKTASTRKVDSSKVDSKKSHNKPIKQKVDSSKVDTSKVDSKKSHNKPIRRKVDSSNVDSKKLSSEILYTIILKACVDFNSLEKIAYKAQKSLSYLKNKIIPAMISEGLLEREFPDIPNHPRQRYRAKKQHKK